MSDASDNRPKKTMFLMIYLGLALFGTLMAIGSYWSAVTPDWRKPAIVLGVIGFFLGGWLLLLLRQRRASAPADRSSQSSE